LRSFSARISYELPFVRIFLRPLELQVAIGNYKTPEKKRDNIIEVLSVDLLYMMWYLLCDNLRKEPIRSKWN